MRTRVVSAVVMLLLFVPIVWIGSMPFYTLIGVIAVLSLKELVDIKYKKNELDFLVKLLAYSLVFCLALNNINSDLIYYLNYKLLAATIICMLVPLMFYIDKQKYNLSDATYLIACICLIGLSYGIILETRKASLEHFILLFIITTVTDTFAYVGGSLIGKNKLLERISPNKTIEGTVVGTVVGTLAGLSFYYIFINMHINTLIVLSVLLLSLVGQIGDLIFSFIKRCHNKKDFSNLIPGHGGLLDRFDSIIFVALTFMFCYIIF